MALNDIVGSYRVTRRGLLQYPNMIHANTRSSEWHEGAQMRRTRASDGVAHERAQDALVVDWCSENTLHCADARSLRPNYSWRAPAHAGEIPIHATADARHSRTACDALEIIGDGARVPDCSALGQIRGNASQQSYPLGANEAVRRFQWELITGDPECNPVAWFMERMVRFVKCAACAPAPGYWSE